MNNNQSPNINFYLIDCIEWMKDLPDKHYNLAIVDPPYGINAPNMSMGSNPKRKGRDKNGEKQYAGVSTAQKIKKGRLNSGGGKLKDRALLNMNCQWDSAVPTQEYWDQLFRVSQNQIIFGGNYFDLKPTRGIGCWDKCQPWENFSQWEMIWTSFDVPAFMIRVSNTGGRNDEIKIHPTQKPVKVYKQLLKKFAKEGDKILDTHGGSASSAIACYDMGFDLDICEIDLDYHISSVQRFHNHKKQLKLF